MSADVPGAAPGKGSEVCKPSAPFTPGAAECMPSQLNLVRAHLRKVTLNMLWPMELAGTMWHPGDGSADRTLKHEVGYTPKCSQAASWS